MLDFIDAFNRGDGERLSRLFFISEGPSPPDFGVAGYCPWSWFSVERGRGGGRVENGYVTYDKGELLCYFAERPGKGERLSLQKVSSTQACWIKRTTWTSSTSSPATPRTSTRNLEARHA